jgi:ATP-dependent Clp protease ATP-binding subunit ClpA
MLNQELELSLNMAFARAREHRHEFMTVEHLLLALLSNPAAREALEACYGGSGRVTPGAGSLY